MDSAREERFVDKAIKVWGQVELRAEGEVIVSSKPHCLLSWTNVPLREDLRQKYRFYLDLRREEDDT